MKSQQTIEQTLEVLKGFREQNEEFIREYMDRIKALPHDARIPALLTAIAEMGTMIMLSFEDEGVPPKEATNLAIKYVTRSLEELLSRTSKKISQSSAAALIKNHPGPAHISSQTKEELEREYGVSIDEIAQTIGAEIVVSDEPLEGHVNYIVCLDYNDGEVPLMSDNIITKCKHCNRGLQHRPHVPSFAVPICDQCVKSLSSEEGPVLN